MEKILLVDDEPEILRDRSEVITSMGYHCITAETGEKAIAEIQKEIPDIILTDQNLPEKDGFAVLEAALKIDPDIPVIIFTGYGSIHKAVRAIKNGAYDYIQKPFTIEAMEIVLNRAIQLRRLKRENIILRSQISMGETLPNVIGTSPAMQKIIRRVLKVAQSDADVFIYGESGTGKELIARSLHLFSPRKEGPFIPLDCVSLPATLLESEIFGFEKGAFTGAVATKPGVFELADMGTLFLDEVTEMDPHLQAKLLRVLQERQLRRIGGQKLIDVDVRIISATNRNPEQAVENKSFRQDLYYRLNVVPIHIPPLRERRDDITQLVEHFIKKYNPFFQVENVGVSREAMQCLRNYEWPGNIRELENIIQRILSLTENETIQIDDLPDELMEQRSETEDILISELPYKEAKDKSLERFSKLYFCNLLKKYDGNISKVARIAGTSRGMLYKILKRYDIIF